MLGAAGQVVSISLGVRSIIGLLAGSVMVLAGLGMTGILAPLARLTPHLPRPVACAAASIARRGPFALGLVNGFMPCGPLQAMQAYAIASGSFAAGALSMASFCAGTIPLVLAFGVFAGTMHRTWRRAMLRVASVMMLIFGLFMLQSGLALVGVQLPGASASRAAGGFVRAQQDGDVQTVTTELRADGYDSIQVRAGVPVRWTIHAAAGTLNGCNGEVVLPGFDQQVKLVEGDNVIQFTPQKAGTYIQLLDGHASRPDRRQLAARAMACGRSARTASAASWRRSTGPGTRFSTAGRTSGSSRLRRTCD